MKLKKRTSSQPFHVSRFTFHDKRGQAMFLSVIAIGGTILGATTIAGLLMLYQIRRTTDFANSAKAIFAADAGLETALYNKFYPCTVPGACPVNGIPPNFMSNGANIFLECIGPSGPANCFTLSAADTLAVKSVGRSGNSYRALFQAF